MAEALAVEAAGAFCLVLEGMPSDLATQITARVDIPTVGIGAGAGCDGQVLVCNDLLGMDNRFKPRFVKRYADLHGTIVAAVQAYGDDVRAGRFPDEAHSFGGPTDKHARSGKLAKLY